MIFTRPTFTLLTEILLTCSVIYIFFEGYNKNIFHRKLALLSIFYETFANLTYMMSKMLGEKSAVTTNIDSSHFYVFLAVFHGLLSLAMFISLVTFLFLAFKNYRNEINYFREHKKLTISFIIFWLVSVSSGALLYFLTYYY
jgi:uncharacterized membrane protein YozB (DUF420 family)